MWFGTSRASAAAQVRRKADRRGNLPGTGARIPRPVRIVRADDRPRPLDLQVIAPGPDLTSLATHQHWEAMYDALCIASPASLRPPC